MLKARLGILVGDPFPDLGAKLHNLGALVNIDSNTAMEEQLAIKNTAVHRV